MANFDTAAKRRSGMMLNQVWRIPPPPSGTIDAGERLAFEYLYSGIPTGGGGSTTSGGGYFIYFMRRRRG